jgi:hypothetical protein
VIEYIEQQHLYLEDGASTEANRNQKEESQKESTASSSNFVSPSG